LINGQIYQLGKNKEYGRIMSIKEESVANWQPKKTVDE
jgi:hypothetical protein